MLVSLAPVHPRFENCKVIKSEIMNIFSQHTKTFVFLIFCSANKFPKGENELAFVQKEKVKFSYLNLCMFFWFFFFAFVWPRRNKICIKTNKLHVNWLNFQFYYWLQLFEQILIWISRNWTDIYKWIGIYNYSSFLRNKYLFFFFSYEGYLFIVMRLWPILSIDSKFNLPFTSMNSEYWGLIKFQMRHFLLHKKSFNW